MPAYPGTGKAGVIQYNQQIYLWQNETVVAGNSSIAVQIRRIEGRSYPWGVSFELSFSGAPGAFEVDIQTADTDQNASYVTINQLSSTSSSFALNSSNVGRLELPSFYAKFVRANVVALANVVTTTLLVTR